MDTPSSVEASPPWGLYATQMFLLLNTSRACRCYGAPKNSFTAQTSCPFSRTAPCIPGVILGPTWHVLLPLRAKTRRGADLSASQFQVGKVCKHQCVQDSLDGPSTGRESWTEDQQPPGCVVFQLWTKRFRLHSCAKLGPPCPSGLNSSWAAACETTSPSVAPLQPREGRKSLPMPAAPCWDP